MKTEKGYDVDAYKDTVQVEDEGIDGRFILMIFTESDLVSMLELISTTTTGKVD